MPTPPTPRLSALVSTYNGERFLQGCLDDLTAQTLFAQHQLEILIVDSASPQNEAAIAAPFVQQYPDRIHYLRTDTRETLYAAWNRAIAHSTAPYLTNANVDDRHHPAMLERLVNLLDQHSDAAVAYADARVTEDANVPFAAARPTRIQRWPDYARDSLFDACYIGQAPVWRRSLHDRHGLFDPAMKSAGDYEFWLRLAAAGEQFVHLPEPLGLYLERPDALSLANLDLSWHESETARARYWNPAWGTPPTLRKLLPPLHRFIERLGAFLPASPTPVGNPPVASTTPPEGLRLALVGAGKHTLRLLPALRKCLPPAVHLTTIFDDRAAPNQHLHGLPVVLPTAVPRASCDLLLISSDAHEHALYTRAKALFPTTPVWRLYAPELE